MDGPGTRSQKGNNMGNNGHHTKQELEAINNALLRLIPTFEEMRGAITKTWEAIKKWYEALPDEIKEKYEQD